MAFGYLVSVVEDVDSSSDEAIGDALTAVYGGLFHDYAVLYLCVTYCGAVSYAGVGSDVCVGSNRTIVSNYDWASDRCPLFDDCVFAYAGVAVEVD